MSAEGNTALAGATQSPGAAVEAPDAHDGAAAKAAHGAPANGNGGLQLYGDSPRSGWEGADSELGFPLDDIPRQRAATTTDPAPGTALVGVGFTMKLQAYCPRN